MTSLDNSTNLLFIPKIDPNLVANSCIRLQDRVKLYCDLVHTRTFIFMPSTCFAIFETNRTLFLAHSSNVDTHRYTEFVCNESCLI